MFELPTRLHSGKSISLNSIESARDKPLRLVVRQKSNKPDYRTTGHSSVFLSTMPVVNDKNPSQARESEVDQVAAERARSLKSSYLASNDLDQSDARHRSSHRNTLEIGTNALRLNLIDANTSPRNTNNGSARRSHGSIKQLLEFDDRSRSITLPLERELRLSQEQTNSITLESGLASETIAGSHKESLR